MRKLFRNGLKSVFQIPIKWSMGMNCYW
jgi:hypothetical protein